MKLKIYVVKFASLLLPFLFSVGLSMTTQAQEDYSRWLGNESKDLSTLLSQFQSLCERRYQNSIEKFKSPYEVALNWNKAHCRCVSRFFKFKNSVAYVQTVNLYLGNKLASMPELPSGLNMFIDAFAVYRLDCEKDPTHISEAERAEMPVEKKSFRPKSNDKTPKGLPVRPQKSGH